VAIGWLLLDMTLVSCGMTALVKAQGDLSAFQLVFIRAMIGLLFITPLIWHHRGKMRLVRHAWRNVLWISCNAIPLTSNFLAITLLPLATVNAFVFSEPLVTMALAVVVLGERVSRIRCLRLHRRADRHGARDVEFRREGPTRLRRRCDQLESVHRLRRWSVDGRRDRGW